MSEQYLARPGVNSKGPNEHWTDAEGVVHIKLTLGKEALVDAADYRKVAPYRWHAAKQKIKHGELFYAITSIKGEDGKDKTLRMHVLLRDPPDGFVVDHIFGDGLDNRSAKTRIVTSRVNTQNRHHPRYSDHPGVCWNKRVGKWTVAIWFEEKIRFLGYFENEDDAAAAYQKAFEDVEKGCFVPRVIEWSSAHRGVAREKRSGKWRSYVQYLHRRCNLGTFDTEDQAHAVYVLAMKQISDGTFVPPVFHHGPKRKSEK